MYLCEDIELFSLQWMAFPKNHCLLGNFSGVGSVLGRPLIGLVILG